MDTLNLRAVDADVKQELRHRLRSEHPYNVLIGLDEEFCESPQELARRKHIILEELVGTNGFAQAIAQRKVLGAQYRTIDREQPQKDDASELNHRPLTTFAVHEFLRKTRYMPQEESNDKIFTIGEVAITRERLHEYFKSLVHNTNLDRVDPKVKFLTSPLFAGTMAAIGTAAYLGQDMRPEQLKYVIAGAVLNGLLASGAAYSIARLIYGRKLNVTSPWNTALYMDTNLVVFAKEPELLYAATREAIPRPQFAGIKRKPGYYAHTLELDAPNFTSMLLSRYQAAKEKK